MNCDHPNCQNKAVYLSSDWTENGDGLYVFYWCEEHAPLDDESLEWFGLEYFE